MQGGMENETYFGDGPGVASEKGPDDAQPAWIQREVVIGSWPGVRGN